MGALEHGLGTRARDDIFDLGAQVMIPDFAIEHPDGRRAILEIVGFWTPEYLESKDIEDPAGGG